MAQVAEVSVTPDGKVRVHRVVCAIDCGTVVNPATIEAQMEGAIVMGLSAALYGEITLKDGRVEQGNFTDYPILRIDEMPVVDVHIVPSKDAPGGTGEPGVPPVAPALSNADFRGHGKTCSDAAHQERGLEENVEPTLRRRLAALLRALTRPPSKFALQPGNLRVRTWLLFSGY